MPEYDNELELTPPGPEVEDGLALEEDPAAVVAITEEEPPPLGVSWSFDMGEERFRMHGRRPVEVRGLATLVGWIDKYLHTQRGVLAIHPPWFGMTDPLGIFGRPIRELSSSDLLADMQGMTNHPNIAEVVDARLESDELDEAAYLEVDVLTDPPSEDVDLMRLRYSLL